MRVGRCIVYSLALSSAAAFVNAADEEKGATDVVEKENATLLRGAADLKKMLESVIYKILPNSDGESSSDDQDSSSETDAMAESLAALKEMLRGPLANMFTPTESRLRFGNVFVETMLPIIASTQEPEDALRMEKGLKDAMHLDEQHFKISKKMEKLKHEIEEATDPEREAELRSKMRNYAKQLEDLFFARLSIVSDMYQLGENNTKMLRKSPLVKGVKELYDAAVIEPYNKYM